MLQQQFAWACYFLVVARGLLRLLTGADVLLSIGSAGMLSLLARLQPLHSTVQHTTGECTFFVLGRVQ